jgi:hypothetical protein
MAKLLLLGFLIVILVYPLGGNYFVSKRILGDDDDIDVT